MSSRKCSLWLLCCWGLLLSAGCGEIRPQTYPVRGTVRFADGTPVAVGMVEFLPSSGRPSARAKISRDGHFVLGTYGNDDGAISGKHQVLVIQHFSGNTPQDADHQHEGENGVVDLRFSHPETSPLSVTVDERENEVALRVERSPFPSGRTRRGQP
jgi:hypothetical protein